MVFAAVDETAGHRVLLRRFFPFGPAGRGLNQEERQVFEAVVECLKSINHPALVPVVAGGVDPVDGLPFVADEVQTEASLAMALQHGLLSPADVAGLLDSLLETAAVISAALGLDGMWLETQPASIHWGRRGDLAVPRFRIAPLRCLWTGEAWLAAHELARITEAAFGWQDAVVADQAGEGLGAWTKWCRAHPQASITQLREALATATRKTAPEASWMKVTRPGPRPIPAILPPPTGRSRIPLILAMTATLAAVTVGGWWTVRQSRLSRPAVTVSQAPALPSAPVARPLAQPPRRPVAAVPAPPSKAKATPAPSPSPAPRRQAGPSSDQDADRIYRAEEVAAIMSRFHKEVTIEGLLAKISLSGNRKTWYLEFSEKPGTDRARAFLPVLGDPSADLESLKPLIGRHIRVRGAVDGEIVGPLKLRRPKVLLKNRDALRVTG